MECGYCRTENEEDERRCVRCGRRLDVSLPLAFSSSTAPDLEILTARKPAILAPPENLNYQRPLFREASRGSNVIPIPTLTPVAPPLENPSPARRRVQTRSPRSGSTRSAQQQQSLDFYDAFEDSPSGAPVIYCDAPVAAPLHRMIAAAFDASMMLIAVGLFLAIFFLSGGNLVLSKQNAPFLICMAAALALFYRALWCLADGDTPGMRFAGLKLVDFDGRPPDRWQRGLRQAVSLLSLLSAGVGVVWAVVDEEKLTWHDHISQTFPTYN